MDRMKTFFKYFLIVAICYFGSNILIYIGINNTYKDIESHQNTNSNSIIVNIDEAKATSLNGYVKGSIKNDSAGTIKETYIKIDFYSARDVNMGTKYIKVENLVAKSTADFDIDFKFSNVSYCIISVVDEI